MTTESDSVSTISPTTYLMSGSSGLIERSLNLITTVGCVSLNLAKLTSQLQPLVKQDYLRVSELKTRETIIFPSYYSTGRAA